MKTQTDPEDSLFTDQARGGVSGSLGYNFQDAYVVTALPAWLDNPAFHSFIKEGFEDVDVRFEDDTGTWTWHYQLKDHPIGVMEFRLMLGRFEALVQRPGLRASRFIVGCTGLSKRLASLWKRILQFRGARRSHSEAALQPTKEELEETLDKLNLAKWADLIIDHVEIDHENPGLRDADPAVLMERFRGKFMDLPFHHGEGSAVLNRLFVQLMVRINRAVRNGISRDDILRLIEQELASATKGPATVVYLHGWIRQNYDVAPDIEIDWTGHFDHASRRVASPQTWMNELLPGLEDLRKRLDGGGHQRTIWLRARAPLSGGFAFGHAFADAAGYNIAVQQPSPGLPGDVQYWKTEYVTEQAANLEVRETQAEGRGDEVAVGIGVTDDVQARVEEYLGQAGLRLRAVLYISPPGGPSPTSVNEHNAGAIAVAIKREMRRFSDHQKARLIHLFYFGPFGLAVMLGQKLNGLPDIQCYERDKAAGYTPSCRLPA